MRVRQPVVVAVGCALLALVLGLLFAGDRVPSGADEVARSAVDGWPHWVLVALVFPTEPYVVGPVVVLLAAWCLRAGRPRDAVFAVLAPVVAVVVNTWVLKPAFDRWKNDVLVYPSGHTVSMVAVLVVVFVLFGPRVRAVVAVGGPVLLVCVALGMVGLGYHYVTDVAGGAAFAVPAVLALRGVMSLDRHANVGARE
ncbi:phosphatase PAP2 family protein [Actinophytocola sp. KF-1]